MKKARSVAGLGKAGLGKAGAGRRRWGQALSRIHCSAKASERACACAPLVISQTREPVAKLSGTRARITLIMLKFVRELNASTIDVASQHNGAGPELQA